MTMPSPKAIASASSSPVAAGSFSDLLNTDVSNGYLKIKMVAPAGSTATLTGGGIISATELTKITLDANGIPSAGQSMFMSDQFASPVNPGFNIEIHNANDRTVGTITGAVISGAPPVDLTTLTSTTSGASFPGAVMLAPSGNQTISSGNLTLTSGSFSGQGASFSSGTVGNVAQKEFSVDNAMYVSTGGNDSNDGLSWGTAKATPQAAFNLATNSGAHAGIVFVAPGSYTGPSTWYSNLAVIGCGPQMGLSYSANFSFAASTGGVSFTYSSNCTLTLLTNVTMANIAFAFANTGGGLVLNSVSASIFDDVLVNQAGNASQDAVQLKTNSSSGTANNTAFNVFRNLAIVCNNAGSPSAANGLTLTGAGAVNAGTFVTDNRFYNLTIAGGIKNAIKCELNSDSNQFHGIQINNNGAANGDALVFNSATPGSTQDVANEMLIGVTTTGSFNHTLSMGTCDGIYIEISSGATVTPNVLGGSQTYDIHTIGLTGVAISRVMLGGTSQLGNTIINGTSGKITKYNNVTTAGAGIGVLVAVIDLTAQTSSIGTTTLFATGTTPGAGLYVAIVDAVITQVGTGGTLLANISWNNGSSSTGLNTSTISLTALGAELGAGASGTVVPITSAASQNITYSATLGGATGSPLYTLKIRLFYLG